MHERAFSLSCRSTQCRDNFLAEGCVMALSLMFYGPSAFLSVDDYVVIGQTWPASVSTRNMDHWAQVGPRGGVNVRVCSGRGKVGYT